MQNSLKKVAFLAFLALRSKSCVLARSPATHSVCKIHQNPKLIIQFFSFSTHDLKHIVSVLQILGHTLWDVVWAILANNYRSYKSSYNNVNNNWIQMR